MNLGEHLNATLNKAGVPVDDPALVELTKKVANLEISDELVSKFDKAFLTFDAAKNNPEIKKHFYAPALNGVDSEILNTIQEMEIDEETKSEILAEKSTYKRVNILAKKVKELESKKTGATKGEKAELSKQIETLNSEIKNVKTASEKAIAQKESEFNEKLKDVYLAQHLSGFKYASDLAKEEDYMIPKSKIQKELSDKKLRVVLDGKNFKLETESGMEYFENNTKVDFNSFATKVLAQHKLTVVSDGSAGKEKKTIEVNNNKGGLNTSKYQQRLNELEEQQTQTA